MSLRWVVYFGSEIERNILSLTILIMKPLTDFQHPEFSLALNQALQAQQRHTVLVIDDNDGLREALKASYTIEEAQDNQQGFDLAMKILPDLIITDLIIPDLQGESLCFRLKHNEKTSHIPIIILTNQDDLYSRVKSFYLGADDYMMRPFQLIELQIRIQNLIQSRKALQKKYSRLIELKPSPVEVQSEDELFLQRVMVIVEKNMDNPMFGAEEFAKQIGLSQTRLYRKLITLTGYASNDFIRRMRLKRAADLLHKQVGNISEVAYQVGFNSLSYFAKCFKELHQYSPREFAKRGYV
jgi:YesN/AraC family two-component response regulator